MVPQIAGFLLVSNETHPCETMKVDHGSDHRRDVANHVNKQGVRKQFTQTANVKRIRGRSIDPASLCEVTGFFLHKIMGWRVWRKRPFPSLSLQINFVPLDQLIYRFAESDKKFVLLHI